MEGVHKMGDGEGQDQVWLRGVECSWRVWRLKKCVHWYDLCAWYWVLTPGLLWLLSPCVRLHFALRKLARCSLLLHLWPTHLLPTVMDDEERSTCTPAALPLPLCRCPQGRALNESADPNCKVLVVGNPCNTNALIAMENAPRLKRKNFHAVRSGEGRGGVRGGG